VDLELAGRRALVTGGSRGIGKAAAAALLAEGAEVAIAARDQTRLDEAAAGLSVAAGRAVPAFGADTGDDASVRQLVAAALPWLLVLAALLRARRCIHAGDEVIQPAFAFLARQQRPAFGPNPGPFQEIDIRDLDHFFFHCAHPLSFPAYSSAARLHFDDQPSIMVYW